MSVTTDAAEPPDDAGEFVLGTLDERAWAAAERRLEVDREFAVAVARWEGRLAPLALMVEPATPPGWVWRRLAVETSGGRGAERGPRPALWRSVGVWRAATAASLALAAGLALVVSLERMRVPQGGTALVTLGRPEAAFVVAREAGGALDVRAVAPGAVPAGRQFELWGLAAGAKVPVALGMVSDGFARVPARLVPAGAVTILVSEEPVGGSRTGLPTGRVVYGGSLGK